jgi:aldehyde dehydrogenase (NAD+)
MTAIALPTGLLIGGQWRNDASGGTMPHVNPATGRVQAEFPVAGEHEVDDAVRAARAALRDWRRLPAAERARMLHRIAAGMRERADELGMLTTLENGTLHRYAASFAEFGATWFDYYAGWTDKLHGAHIGFPGALDYTIVEPVGVVGIFLTWNGPTGSIGMKAAAALAAGCTIIIKTPDLAPFTTKVFGEICTQVGLPDGVVNVLTGGADTGYALVRHPGVDKISFTVGEPGLPRR